MSASETSDWIVVEVLESISIWLKGGGSCGVGSMGAGAIE